MNKIIEETFKEMVTEIQKNKTKNIEPNRYHETASVSEVNLVYHFAKQLEKKSAKCAVYLEFPCDSGRVDAVILYENNIFLIEAKTKMDNKKYQELNAQAMRFINTDSEGFKGLKGLDRYKNDSSLRDTLKDRVLEFMVKEWNIKNNINIYGILLADALSEYQKDKWDYATNPQNYIDCKLDCMKEYTFFDCIPDVNNENTIWYLGAFRKIGIL